MKTRAELEANYDAIRASGRDAGMTDFEMTTVQVRQEREPVRACQTCSVVKTRNRTFYLGTTDRIRDGSHA